MNVEKIIRELIKIVADRHKAEVKIIRIIKK